MTIKEKLDRITQLVDEIGFDEIIKGLLTIAECRESDYKNDAHSSWIAGIWQRKYHCYVNGLITTIRSVQQSTY